MAQYWNGHVNTKFYGQDGGYKENTESVEFKSGRSIEYLKNSTPKRTHSLNLRCNDSIKIDGRTEFEWLLYWYENTIRSGTIPVYLTDIVTHTGYTLYRVKIEGWNGQKSKEISLVLEEI